jgi:hypothetical protein
MSVVDLSNWTFSFGGSDSRLAGTEYYQAPEIVRFATPIHLLLHLGDDDARDSETQNQIQRRLRDDPGVQELHGQRTNIGSMPHFEQYRESKHYKLYHAAAAAVSAGNASQDQQARVSGLDQEILTSRVIVSADQVLFHGRADQVLHASATYPSFISTSLDPLVCVFHAVKRRNQIGPNAKAVIYAFTLRDPLHAIWGNGGKLKEWELLLQSRLSCLAIKVHQRSRFDVVEATVGL